MKFYDSAYGVYQWKLEQEKKQTEIKIKKGKRRIGVNEKLALGKLSCVWEVLKDGNV